nr:NADH dehydrogenase subunit 6 [Aristosyrphus sp.]
MIQMFFMMNTIIMSLIFMQMNHPLSMGLMLLMQTLMIACITGMICKTFWFSYILFIIFVGGMLVLFIYMTSLASNEIFDFSKKGILLMFFFMIFSISFMLLDKYFMFYKQNNEMIELNKMNFYMEENTIMLMKLYNYPMNYLTIMLMIYLLITMIASIKITKLFYGPIRSMF